jgi:ubiquinone/menaquinone biosynthesis C-methylase UbiE
VKFANTYGDARYAAAYAELEFHATYYLAYRDLPELILANTNKGGDALDFGCGAGRSTRFLKQLGFETIGVDIAEDMLNIASATDPAGNYVRVEDGDLGILKDNSFDLVLSAFTFDNIPTRSAKTLLFRELSRVLRKNGVIVNLVSSPEIYTNEWMSFSTRDYPENRQAKSGDVVKIIITDIDDKRPVEDIVCSPEDYASIYDRSGLKTITCIKPLATGDEPYEWVNETRIAPWTVYVLKSK